MQVLVRDNNVDQALKALKKKMQREGIFREMKLRGHYEKPSEKKAREKAEAVRRARKLARKKMQREGLLPMKPRVVPGAGRCARWPWWSGRRRRPSASAALLKRAVFRHRVREFYSAGLNRVRAISMCGVLRPEHQPCADRRVDHLVAERGAGQIVEPVAGAMADDQVSRIDIAEFLDGLVDVVVAERRHDMEAADHGVHLVDARRRHRLAHGVDDAAMAA